MAQFTHKITQDARHFFICVLCGPFSDRSARLAQRASCCLTRTCVLSVGGSSLGTPPPTPLEKCRRRKREKRLAQDVLRTHTTAYLISRAKTAQDARQFFVWRFGGSANDRSLQLEPQICLLTNSTGRSPNLCLALQRFCQRPQCAMRAPNGLENRTGPWPICFLALRRLCQRPHVYS